MTDTKTTILVLEEFANKYAKRADFVGLGEHARADMFREFARDVRLDLLPAILAQQSATPAEAVSESVLDSRRLLKAASDALRSYQYGNSSTDLAEAIADRIDAALAQQAATTAPAAQEVALPDIKRRIAGLRLHPNQCDGDHYESFNSAIDMALDEFPSTPPEADELAQQPAKSAVPAALDVDAIFAAMYSRDPYWDTQGRSSAEAVRLALKCVRATNDTGASNGN